MHRQLVPRSWFLEESTVDEHRGTNFESFVQPSAISEPSPLFAIFPLVVILRGRRRIGSIFGVAGCTDAAQIFRICDMCIDTFMAVVGNIESA